MWLCGSVGAVGKDKTSTVARIIEWSLQDAQLLDNAKVCYFYCTQKQGKENDLGTETAAVLRSLIRQLAWRNDYESLEIPIIAIYEKLKVHRPSDANLSIQDATSILAEMLSFTCHNSIIIDALDECAHPREFLRSVAVIMDRVGGRTRFLISGRGNADVSTVLKSYVKISMDAHDTGEDIYSYIYNEVKRGPRCLLEGEAPDLEDGVINTHCQRAQGMFRWVELQLAIFMDEDDPLLLRSDVEDRLDRLQSEIGIPNLMEVYDEIYTKNTGMSSRARDYATKCYKIILCSERPLYNYELTAAVALNSDGSYNAEITATILRKICSNLLIVNSQKQVVFAHLSVIEYLKGGSFQQYLDRSCHKCMAELCLTYVSHHICQVDGKEANLLDAASQTGLSSYVILHWPYRCQKAGIRERGVGRLRDLFWNMMSMPNMRPQFERWRDLLASDADSIMPDVDFDRIFHHAPLELRWKEKLWHSVSYPPVPFFAACAYGHDELISYYLIRMHEVLLLSVSVRNIADETGLNIAAFFGCLLVVRLLL